MSDEEYLLKHQIPHLIDDLLLDMVKDRPADVLSYFQDWLRARKSKTGGRTFFVGGNWKCNGTKDSIKAICDEFAKGESIKGKPVEVCLGCPSLYLDHTRRCLREDWGVALQNTWTGKGGAFTGETSVDMAADLGVKYVILGHSERRNLPELKESDEVVATKTAYAISKGLTVLLCCGEQLEERESGKTNEVNERQLGACAKVLKEADWAKVVIAYEPVWAIGTGKVATPEQAQETHKCIREWVSKTVSPAVASAVRILYGGSVSEKNCDELAKCPDIDGFLVGGASLKPGFLQVVDAYKQNC